MREIGLDNPSSLYSSPQHILFCWYIIRLPQSIKWTEVAEEEEKKQKKTLLSHVQIYMGAQNNVIGEALYTSQHQSEKVDDTLLWHGYWAKIAYQPLKRPSLLLRETACTRCHLRLLTILLSHSIGTPWHDQNISELQHHSTTLSTDVQNQQRMWCHQLERQLWSLCGHPPKDRIKVGA